ncbi:MAG: helix-turn-helix domain-containing protein [Rhodospirillaceae bacterium]|nr:helix-turn-helix domain-containing protein [Rhodospirillaceae bacterium]
MTVKKRKAVGPTETDIHAHIAAGPHTVAIVIYPEIGPYDVAAAAEVFSTTNGQVRRERGINHDVYRFETISSVPGPVTAEMGLKLMPDRTVADPAPQIDTLLISGSCWEPMQSALADAALIGWLKVNAPKARRIVSMCTGAFLMAQAGLVKRSITTHWAQCDRLRELFPHLDVRADNIYVKEGNVYSSSGSTAAMDLMLALVEEDLGRATAMNVARRLVMFLKRPGGQAQFSAALLAQAAETDSLRELVGWIAEHLAGDLSVETLAARAGMSPRNFARVFQAETKFTPAKYVERARLEHARRLIEDTELPLATVARRSGFNDQQMRRAFARWLGVNPADYVERFRTSALNGDGAPTARRTRQPEQDRPWLP